MKPYAAKFYKSKQWKNCRASYFNHRYGLCERCQGPGKIVHHKSYITPDNINDPDITLSFTNLELLCQDCHNREHHEKNSPTIYGLMFDKEGNLVQKSNNFI
ncbi:HNH endonuclease [Bacillus sp. ISL-46]|uniref:HNH endonuclease n=1 Tax=Bacillus sp. ISL-46 TaxID=2819129 RepID=UPI001BE5F427|nr:HNH endonuclease [Bacillus sp. ISL-46]MBT2722304.1 HNH endonuclease [Bacillus sp. ISL-46]